MSAGEPQNTGAQSQQKTPPVDPLIGKILDGRFELVRLLGAGGMGAVYQATNLGVNRPVAIKIMHPQYMLDERTTLRFKQEVTAMSALSHPNLIGIIDAGTTEFGSPYFVMEYLPSKPLNQILQEEVFLTAERAKPILMQIADALAHAHDRHIIHRDLKPANILVIESGTRDHVKVVDLGVAKLLGGEDDGAMMKLTRTGEVFGSPLYMAPEQVLGRAHDMRTDIYQLGCVMFEMLTGVPPLVGASAILTMNSHVEEAAPKFQAVMPDLPMDDQMRELERIVLKCLEKDPAARFQTMHEFMRALEFGMEPEPLKFVTATPDAKQKVQNVAAEKRVEKAAREDKELDPESLPSDDAQKKQKLILYSVFGVAAMLVIIFVSMFVGSMLTNKNDNVGNSSNVRVAPSKPEYKKYQKEYKANSGDLYDVRVLSVYEGSLTPENAKKSEARFGRVVVDVEKEGKPLILVLNAYQPTMWTIKPASGKVNIKQVYAIGYYPQNADGVPSGVPLYQCYYPYFNSDATKADEKVHTNPMEPFYFTYVGDEDVLGSDTYASMKKAFEKRTKCQLRRFDGVRSTDRFVVK